MSDNSNSGIGFIGLLTIAFIVLKLCHVITWSWWWVLAPIWGGLAIIPLIILIIISSPYLAVGFVLLLHMLNAGGKALITLFKKLKEICKQK